MQIDKDGVVNMINLLIILILIVNVTLNIKLIMTRKMLKTSNDNIERCLQIIDQLKESK